jgi:hypothetical protein
MPFAHCASKMASAISKEPESHTIRGLAHSSSILVKPMKKEEKSMEVFS